MEVIDVSKNKICQPNEQFCGNCGCKLSENYKYCSKCGAPISFASNNTLDEPSAQSQIYAQYQVYQQHYQYPQFYQPVYYYAPYYQDGNSTGLNILSFLFPLIGFVLYLVFHDTKPIKAHGCGLWSLTSFLIGLGILILEVLTSQ